MIDLELLRQKPEVVKNSISKRGGHVELVDSFIALDQTWRGQQKKIEDLRGERNTLTSTKESAQDNRDRLVAIKQELQTLEAEEKLTAAQRLDQYLRIPQIMDDDLPVGPGETANKVLSTHGEIKRASGKPHDELMTALGWLDIEKAAKVSGSRFRYLKGEAAMYHLQLVNKAISFAAKRGFIPVIPPVITREETLIGGGFFPTGKEDVFAVGDSYLLGTSEPMLVSLGRDTVYNRADLPVRYVGFSTCFRKEVGSYGKDTNGMFRQYQFDKVEMVSICHPDDSKAEHEFLRKNQEDFVTGLGLPYQVMLIGSGDLEIKATRRYDIEQYFPGQQRYRETHSVSNCGDYQARRMNIKVRDGDKEVVAHTLNGTLYTERTLLSLIENNQQDDGSVSLPELQ